MATNPVARPSTRVTIENRPPASGNIEPSSPMQNATFKAMKHPMM
jgi:hypothetical protein